MRCQINSSQGLKSLAWVRLMKEISLITVLVLIYVDSSLFFFIAHMDLISPHDNNL